MNTISRLILLVGWSNCMTVEEEEEEEEEEAALD
jgi:hypothetical protein